MRFTGLLVAGIALGIAASVVEAAPVTYKDFQAGSSVVSGQKVVHRLFIPKGYRPTKKYPLVVTLHGAGERGADDSIQLKHTFNRMWADSAVQAKNPAFVLAPQCPAAPFQWVNTPWAKGSYDFASTAISIPMQAVVKVLDSLEKIYSLDVNRIYVTGLSMGGYGTWYMLMKYPDRFAAAIPVCGAGDTLLAPAISKVPLWAFHAEDDVVVPVKGSRDMISALKKAGGNPKYTEYPSSQKVGHASWDPAARTEGLADWLFAQSKSTVSIRQKQRREMQEIGLRPSFYYFGILHKDALGRSLN